MRVSLHGGVRDGHVFWVPTDTAVEDVEAIEALDPATDTWVRYEPLWYGAEVLHLTVGYL